MVKLAAVLSLPLLLVSMAASSSCLIVDVKEGGPDGMHLIIPVPLMLVQAAMAFVPEEYARVPCPELAEHLPAAQRIIDELQHIQASELVRVEEDDELVVVSKIDGRLEVEVHGANEDVSVALPLATVSEILDSFDGERFDAGHAVAALRGVSRTDLVHVRDGDDEVKITLW